MNLEDRQSALENEMNTAKDTIWRLTNRIFNLENEVGKLKQVLRVTNFRTVASNANSTKLPSAKLAEIARRRQKSNFKQIIERRTQKQEFGVTKSSNNNKELPDAFANLEVKQEPISDTEENDAENVQPHSSYNHSDSFNSQSQHATSTGKGVKVRESDDIGSDSSGSGSSDYGSDDDYITPGFSALRRKSSSGNRLSVGRPIGSVWRHFKKIAVKSEDGTAVMRAVCKYCNQAVSPRSDRLKPHIRKCLANDKKESGLITRTAKYTSRKMEKSTQRRLSVIPKTERIMKTSMLAFEGVNEELETQASHSYKLNRSMMRGRKKGPIWQYFDEAWISMANGERRTIAVCKMCKKHLDKKTDRLRTHLKKCPNSRFVDSTPPPQILSSVSMSTIQESTSSNQSAIDSTITATEPTEITVQEQIERNNMENEKIVEPHGAVPTVENINHCDEESDLETMFDESGVLSVSDVFMDDGALPTVPEARKRSLVWDSFKVVAVVGTEANSSGPKYTAVCHRCNQEVIPKTFRLQNHLNICPGTGVDDPVSST